MNYVWKPGKLDLKENKQINICLESKKTAISFLHNLSPPVVHHLDVVLMLLCGYRTMRCLEPCLVLTQETGRQDVPKRSWAPGSLHGPQLVCFSGWKLPIRSPSPPTITLPHQECKHMENTCTCSVRAVYAHVCTVCTTHKCRCQKTENIFSMICVFLCILLHLDVH